MFIYVIVNSETLKIYVGQHKGDSLKQYLQRKLSAAAHREASGSHLFASMRKYPKDVWSIHPLISDLQTREECDHWERLLIASMNSQNSGVGYNICRGGEGNSGPGYWLGKKHPIKAPKRPGWSNKTTFATGHAPTAGNLGMPSLRKGKPAQYHSAETRQRALNGLIPGKPGWHHTEAARKQMSLSHRGPKPWLVGVALSAEHRQNLSESHKGKPWSVARRQAHIDKMAIS